jgi:hypothetical protein
LNTDSGTVAERESPAARKALKRRRREAHLEARRRLEESERRRRRVIWAGLGALAVVGLGIGLFTSPNNSAVMGAVPARRRGVASGVLATARTLGNVLGIGMAGAIFSTVMAASGVVEPSTVIAAVSAGLLASSATALLGAVTSATRPVAHDLS